jgi:hypothetical protein
MPGCPSFALGAEQQGLGATWHQLRPLRYASHIALETLADFNGGI